MTKTNITAADLKKEVTPQDFDTLTAGDGAVAEHAIHKAVLWVYGKVKSTGNGYDESNDVVKEIVLKRAVYELHTYVGNESRAKAKERDAVDLIESYFGSIAAKDDAGGTGPAAALAAGEEPPAYGG